ncbi:MAG: hypothetical protein V4507_08650, partial [Verrucomicrobiota bacterium]
MVCGIGGANLYALDLYSTSVGADGTRDDYLFKQGTFESGIPVRNTNNTFVGKGYDWSETGWINLGDTQRLHGLSMISPLQYWAATHNQPATGSIANFFNGTSIVQATTTGGYINENSSDIYIGGFASALSNSSNIHISRILDISSGNYIGQKGFGVGSQQKSIDEQHEQKGQQIGTGEITSLSTDLAAFTGVGGETLSGGQSGDSGSPFFYVDPITSQAAMVGTLSYGDDLDDSAGGPWYDSWNKSLLESW